MKKILISAALAFAAVSAHADTFTVSAYDNSSSGGTGLASINLVAGEAFTVSAGVNDLWSAGDLPRFSNADGLTYSRVANALDDSGYAPGTLIGIDFGQYSQNGYSAAYGTLVGEIGGQYMTLGTNFSGVAPASGTLKLFYWDSNNGDNTGSIAVNVSAVPEPSGFLMMGAGLLALAALRKRKGADKA